MAPDLSRYSCQIALPGFGEATQQHLQNSSVLIVGAGGLGCPAAQYLAAAGIGNLGIADNDVVSVTNLHRQVLFTPLEAGLKKAIVAANKLQQQNPGIRVTAHDIRVTSANVQELIKPYDVVVDCTDNFETRYLLNDAGLLSEKPVIYGAIYRFEGQVAVWNVKNENGTFSPNYRDLFPKVNASQIPDCAEGGVVPTLAGIVGCMQANEVLKYLTKTGDLLTGKLLLFDALTMQSQTIRIGNVTKTNILNVVETINAPTMTAAEVKKGLLENALELLDIRTHQERDEIDIGGEHIEADELPDNFDYINNGIPKILYCSSGKRSAEAVKMIKKLFPEAKVYSMEGGLTRFLDWKD